MNPSYSTNVLAVALFGFGTSACLQVGAEIPSACFLQTDVNIAAIGPVDPEAVSALREAEQNGLTLPAQFAPELDSETTFTREGLDELPSTLDDLGVDSRIALSFVQVFATKGLDSFEGVEAIRLRMTPTDPNSPLEAMDLADCVAAEGCDTSGQQVNLSGGAGVDLLPYLRQGSLDFTLTVQGAAPLEIWTFDVDVCMAAKGNYERSLF